MLAGRRSPHNPRNRRHGDPPIYADAARWEIGPGPAEPLYAGLQGHKAEEGDFAKDEKEEEEEFETVFGFRR